MTDLLGTSALLVPIICPLAAAGLVLWLPRAAELDPAIRVCAVFSFISISFYALVEGFLEPAALVHSSTGRRLEFALGGTAVTGAVALTGAALAAITWIAGQYVTSKRAARLAVLALAGIWLLTIYVGFVVNSVEDGFDICLPPGTQVGDSCETSPG